MCGRYFIDAKLEDIEQLVGPLSSRVRLQPRYNIAPEQPVAVIHADATAARHLTFMRWGLIPGWSKGPDRRFSMINARAETVAEKPAYRSAIRYRRCLIPASGFYEWRAGAHKQPFVIRRTDQQLMMFAGLWEDWMGPDGSEISSCSIIVTEANAAVRPVHERMPVILDRKDFAHWLDRSEQHSKDVLPLLKPCEPQVLEVYPVSREVNNPQHDGPRLIQSEEAEGLFD